MSRRNKLEKFGEIAGSPHVYENFDVSVPRLVCMGGEVDIRGRWAQEHFHNDHPLVLELGCGKGEYTVGLAQKFPDHNFIGVDIKGARIWRGVRRIAELGLVNAAFVRARIEFLPAFFAPDEVEEIWITFPDPFPRDRQRRRRLTAPHFLDIYRRVLVPSGRVHLKTDDPGLYEFTLETIAGDPQCTLVTHSDDIYAGVLPHPALEIKTFYELQHLAEGRTIKYVQCVLTSL